MPGRKTPLVTNEIYHIFNHSLDDRPVFVNKRECSRALEALNFYHFDALPFRLSYFLKRPKNEKTEMIKDLSNKGKKLVDFLCFCLMPTHFHLLLKQKKDNGISKFMSDFQNSFTRYFNSKHERKGALFLDQFKAVRIVSQEQFVHVSRYVHLNPYSSFVIKSLEKLENYPWSSLPEYAQDDKKQKICDVGPILSFFKNSKGYLKFIFDQADYQRELDRIKHLALEG